MESPLNKIILINRIYRGYNMLQNVKNKMLHCLTGRQVRILLLKYLCFCSDIIGKQIGSNHRYKKKYNLFDDAFLNF